MLRSNEKGYAVINKSTQGVSFLHSDLETCKKYCRYGCEIVEVIPKKHGISFRLYFYKFSKPFNFKHHNNILWLHWDFDYIYFHKYSNVVYEWRN